MKPPRMTCRTLMIAIALAALATWGGMLWHRSAGFAAKAVKYEIMKVVDEWNMSTIEYDSRGRRRWPLTAREETERAILERRVQYADRMYRKYRRAVYFPWLPVEPDPAPHGEHDPRCPYETRLPTGDRI